jgi:hypothetical protein
VKHVVAGKWSTQHKSMCKKEFSWMSTSGNKKNILEKTSKNKSEEDDEMKREREKSRIIKMNN